MRTPHSSTNKGKRVKITMKDGTIVIGKFYDKKSGTIMIDLEETRDRWGTVTAEPPMRSKVPMKEVRAFSIYKPTSK